MEDEIYVSTDIEADGKIPGRNSMLSLGSAAFRLDTKEPVATFSINLDFLAGAVSDPKTMTEFWDKNPKAWEACRKDTVPVTDAMRRYVKWVEVISAKEKAKPVFVGYPAGFDFLFVYWYICNADLESPFSFSALDIKTYAAAMMKTTYRNSTKRNFPRHWFPKNTPHTHVAVEDAIEQGHLFMNMMRENLNTKVFR